MSSRRDPLVGIGIFYIAVKFQTLNGSWVVEWFTVPQQPLQQRHMFSITVYIRIVSKLESTNPFSPVKFQSRPDKLNIVENAEFV